MKYVTAFRDPALARTLAAAIARDVRPDRSYRLMEFCGGHTHALARHGVLDVLPDAVRMVHGPGCPVCVLPMGRIAQAIALAKKSDVILATYGDTMRVPTIAGESLLSARAAGGDVRMVYSVDDALALARAHHDRQVVFLAIGFETTTPPTAVAVRRARAEGLSNFTILCNHVLTPAAMHAILDQPEPVALDGLVGPAHVSTIIGTRPYEVFAERYRLPVVIAGFEPLDLLQAIWMLVRQVNDGRAVVENQFTRAVAAGGNPRARAVIDEVFERRDTFAWRGLGQIPHSALRLAPAYVNFDAERRFALEDPDVKDHPACRCGPILRGHETPLQCRLFGTACTPERPLGACMVSAEGACAAEWLHRPRGRGLPVVTGNAP